MTDNANQITNDYRKIIEEGIKKTISSNKWKEYLMFHTKFKKYSFNNTMLIYIQRPNATLVAGVKTWESVGRKIKDSELKDYIKIIAPKFKKHTIVTEDGSSDFNQLTDFISVKVYDISQTEGKEIPSICNNFVDNEEKEEKASNYYNLLKNLVNNEVPIKEEQLGEKTNGFYHRIYKYIAINQNIGFILKFKTLVHEYTHFLLHHSFIEDEISKSQAEIEAESIAFIVLKYFNFNVDEYSFEYLATWSEKELNNFYYNSCWEKIERTSSKIIKMIETNNEQFK